MYACALGGPKGLRAPKPNVLENTMSKHATQRREEKLAKELSALAVSNPTHLKFTWKNLLEGWSLEAIRRGRVLQQAHEAGLQL